MIYLDPSVVVTLITPEQHTSAAEAWLQEQSSGTVTVSEWVLTEVASALAIKQRTRVLDDLGRARVQRICERLVSQLEVLPVRPAAFREAARMCARWESGLRGGDALHIAIAADHHMDLCTRDQVQAAAAQHIGLRTVVLPGAVTP